MGDHLRMEESGNPEWDGRQNHSPLAEVQYPPKQHGQHARPSTSPSPDMMDSTSPLSPLARTAQFEEDNRTRAERMADHREQNALLQARNMHVRDFFLENMRSERDRVCPIATTAAVTHAHWCWYSEIDRYRETGQRSGRCGTNDCATAPSL